MKTNLHTTTREKGAAMMVVIIFFLSISMTILVGIITPVVREAKIAGNILNSKKAYLLAESGSEDAIYRIKNSKQISSSEVLTIGSDTTTTNITTIGSNQKQIESVGDSSSKQRKVALSLSTAAGVSFNYGVQVGQGGIDMQGSSGIVGNVYANGPIRGSTSSYITGTAISGNSPSLTANQTNGTGTPANNVNFGNANGTQDIAQSFQVSVESPLNKIQLYVKKLCTPASPCAPTDATVKIVTDSSGSPSTTVLATGTLSAASVGAAYGWIDVSFSTNPILDVGTTYWVVIDAGTNSAKYYIIGASSGGYGSGLGKIGQQGGTWNNTTPSGLDYYFSVYLGGVNGLIEGSSLSQWNQLSVGTGGSGTAQAHTVNYTEATGLIYCQTGTGNNKSCTTQTDPTYIAYPISDANIDAWKAEATNLYSGTYNLSGSGTATIGQTKITGDLNVGGSTTLYLSGTVWVQGNVNVSGSAKIVLASSYGSSSGVLVSDGRLALGGSGQLNGTGQTGSYILFITTSNCDASFCPAHAIDISGSAGSVVLNAQNGTLKFSGSASAKEATANKILLEGSTTVTYESGLANMNFNSGPSGTWSIDTWKESQ